MFIFFFFHFFSFYLHFTFFYFLPYLYVVLKDGYTVEDIHDAVYDALELHEHPVKITQLPERPFFHFKTNRVGLRQELKSAAN